MDIRDLELQRQPEPDGEPPQRYPWIWVVAGIVLVLLVVGYLVMGRRAAPEDPAVAEKPAAAPVETREPLGGPGDDIDLPPLNETDPLVRDLVRALSSHPTIVAWLATDNLLHRFTAAVQNIAAGRSPATHAQRIAPAAPFTAAEAPGQTTIDERSYRRYDRIADAVDSIDAAGAARLYSTLKPRLEEGHTTLGTGRPFDEAFERAIFVLLQTPVVEGPVPLTSKGVTYEYADPRLEQLTPAQKHLVRMGPRNTRVIQAKLREIARELGIPDTRLPET